MSVACPTTEQLAAALRGTQSSADDAALSAHLAECPVCQARLEELAGGFGWLKGRVKAHAAAKQSQTNFLNQAMQALESRSPGPEGEPTSPPQLDFLQPSGQPGLLGRFGPYEVLASVAIGGMGIVLKARDPGLNRIVALKILPPALAANSLARARFIREARAAAAVVHEHVVPIYAVDEFAGLPYLVMQFVQGRTLADRLHATGPLLVVEILRIGAQTAAGLAAAHAQGLIHRDVKPGNILLENGVERVKITDFGLARATDDSSLTREGYIAGTPEYMAPEQARNEPMDQRADLFSLGCVLYEMATGVSPFRAEKSLVAMRRLCDEEPPAAHTLNPKIPEWLGQMIQHLMAKAAGARPQTAEEVATELERRLAESQQTGTTSRSNPELPAAPTNRSRPLLWPASAAVLALLLALVWFAVLKPRPESTDGNSPVEPPAIQSTALFVIPASGATPEQGFPTLYDAVAAANDGSVIECRFNGPQAVAAVRRNDKALILRAAPGYEPVLTPAAEGEGLLCTHAPLVLEGLTVLTASVPAPGARRIPRPSVGISIEDGPVLLAHCRFEISAAPDPATSPQPLSIRLVNAPAAFLQNCRIVSRTGFGLHWDWRASTGRSYASRMAIQGCTVEGNLMSAWARGSVAKHLELRDNTLAGGSFLLMLGPNADLPVQITARNNLFDADCLVQRPKSDQLSLALPELVRWSGDHNLYSVASYAQSAQPVTHHDGWLASDAVQETNSLSAKLGIRARLANLTDRTPGAEATAFTLTAEERQRLIAQGWTSPEPPGANPQKTGPGRPYHEWRNSPDYAEWLKLVREHVPQSAANP